MKAEEFRRIALIMAEASESAHVGHPDFRVGGKIFATLGYPDEHVAAITLALEEQEKLLRLHPSVFRPANGAWGRRGSTLVSLEAVTAATIRPAIATAWRRRAPRRLIMQPEGLMHALLPTSNQAMQRAAGRPYA